MPIESGAASQTAARRVVMLSLHTSPLAQAGTGDAGGLNVYVNELAHALAKRGTTVDIVTTDLDGGCREDGSAFQDEARDRVRTLQPGLRVHVLRVCKRCREDKSRLLQCIEDLSARALASLLEADSQPVDLVHSHYWISGLAGISLAASLDAKLVHTMHTIGAVKKERDPTAAEDPRRHEAEQLITATASTLTANTRREAEDLQRIFELPVRRIAMVQPGTALETFHPPTGADPRDEPPNPRPLRLTFAGRLQPHKGPQVAVAAVSRLRTLLPGLRVELTVAGRQSGLDSVDIAELAEKEGISDILALRKPLPHPDLAELFRASDALLVPSYSESFGLVALEAKACGTPVLAHNVGGLAELVDHGATGMLIDSLDPDQWAAAIQRLVSDWTQWKAFSEAAAQLAQSYSWDSTALQALQAYASALSPYTSIAKQPCTSD
ncbi:glycosyltransferase [Nesterenkonia haasae]|uniref:glycosyltransferase n=1 Tax=Nesterenkonia haasae TaxID=2587813 RepID=UPI0013918565|nr:glycosyltransferase [Nesterenkonia haasae]NDK30434.1 glycosyltransferase family 1 protein [Nesterenkonia haasae]